MIRDDPAQMPAAFKVDLRMVVIHSDTATQSRDLFLLLSRVTPELTSPSGQPGETGAATKHVADSKYNENNKASSFGAQMQTPGFYID